MEKISVNELLENIKTTFPIMEENERKFYQWLNETVIPHSTIAKDLNWKYDQFRYKVNNKKFTYMDMMVILTRWKNELV